MFYVTGTKVYLAEFNAQKGVYPEVRLVRESTGQIVFDILNVGTASKPAHREICSAEEVRAKFGTGAAERIKKLTK